jgi:Phage tail protein
VVTAVEVHSAQSYVPKLTFPVGDPGPSSLFHVRGIDGLEPVDAVVNSIGYGSIDGEAYNGSHTGKRNIVISLGLSTARGGASVDEARNLLYAYLMPKLEVTLLFRRDFGEPVNIKGYVEKLTPNRFAQDPTMQVSIICPQPDFIGLTPTQLFGLAGKNPKDIEFIYSGNIIAPLQFSLSMDNLLYEGRVIVQNRTVSSIGYRGFEVSSIFEAGDYIWLESTPGSKVVENRLPTQVSFNLLSRMTPESVWPYLAPGANRMRVLTPSSNHKRPWAIYFWPRFGGI